MDAKSNEIPAVRELLKAFTDLAGAVFTIDAMHTQHDTAQAILGRGADYVMTVKANMPTLYRQLKKLPWTAIPAVRELLKAFADLVGAVLTIDAMHTQHDTAQLILGRGADYVMTVKANMPALYKQLKKLPWAAIPATSA